jgi:phage protein D
MPKVQTPVFKILYLGKDITKDISESLISVTYNDKLVGETDEIDITLEDTEALWRGPWYPKKKDRIKLQMGYDDLLVDCGEFEVDQIEMQGPPDVVSIRGLATWVTSAMRTRASTAHEGKTLKQIAEFIAAKHGYTVQGKIFTIRLERSTQNRETDLEYLKRISKEYGYVFSIRGTTLVFTSVYDLEAGKPVYVIDRSDLIRYSIRDSNIGTYKEAAVKHHDPRKKEVQSKTITAEKVDINKGSGVGQTESVDVLEIRSKTENPQQAEAKAKASLHAANSKQVEGNITVQGYPLLVAGNNFELTGMGVLSGKYHTLQSTHTITKGGGYVTDVSIKRISGEGASKQKTKQKEKANPINKIEIVKLN